MSRFYVIFAGHRSIKRIFDQYFDFYQNKYMTMLEANRRFEDTSRERVFVLTV